MGFSSKNRDHQINEVIFDPEIIANCVANIQLHVVFKVMNDEVNKILVERSKLRCAGGGGDNTIAHSLEHIHTQSRKESHSCF